MFEHPDHQRWWLLFMLLALVGTSSAFAATSGEEAQIAMARELIGEGKSEEASVLLEALEVANKSDPVFNYLLGIARLESDKPEKAIRSFARVLAAGQDFAGIRLDMGRAYFSLGKFPNAKREFQLASKFAPPPEVEVLIAKYLTAIREQEQNNPTAVSGFVEAATGRDSNVTSVVDDISSAVFATYGVPGFKASGSTVSRSSATFGLAGGGQITRRISDALEINAGFEGRNRQVVSANDYSSQQFDARLAMVYTREGDSFRSGLFYQDYRQRTETVGATADRYAAGANIEWRHTLGEKAQLGLFVVHNQQRFRDLPGNDIDSSVIGASWLHAEESIMKPILYGTVFVAQDYAKNELSDGTNVGRNSHGVRFNGQLTTEHDLDLLAGIGYLEHVDRSRFVRAPAVEYGRDRVTELSLGMVWRLRKGLAVRPQINYSDSRSNLAVSEYKRTDLTVTLRYDFQ